MRGTAGHGDRSVPGEARKSEDGLTDQAKIIVRETSLRMRCPNGRACGISDIVKRRSIRVWDLRKQFVESRSLSPGRFGARASQDERVVNDLFSEA